MRKNFFDTTHSLSLRQTLFLILQQADPNTSGKQGNITSPTEEKKVEPLAFLFVMEYSLDVLKFDWIFQT